MILLWVAAGAFVLLCALFILDYFLTESPEEKAQRALTEIIEDKQELMEAERADTLRD